MKPAKNSVAPVGGLYRSVRKVIARQCGNFTKTICGICHDRFIIADQKEIYWSGASLKDTGRYERYVGYGNEVDGYRKVVKVYDDDRHR